MKIAIPLFPGTNRARDAIIALQTVAAAAKIPIEIDVIWHRERFDDTYALVLIAGGFSWGDYLRPAAIAARSAVMSDVRIHADQGRYVVGICNGFQVLTESELLPGALLANNHNRFCCDFVKVTGVTNRFCPRFAGTTLTLPVANHDGNYYAPARVRSELEANEQIVLHYRDHAVTDSTIAGLTNKTGNVFGLMPHPENAIVPPTLDGRFLLQSMLEQCA